MKIKVKLEAKVENRPKESRSTLTEGPTRPTTRLARMLVLAHLIERKANAGKLKDYAEMARILGVSRARMAQIMKLLSLSPVIQEQILRGKGALTERRLRSVLQQVSWDKQLTALDTV